MSGSGFSPKELEIKEIGDRHALRPLTDVEKGSAPVFAPRPSTTVGQQVPNPAYFPADHGQILPFSPEGAAQRREASRRAKYDVSRGEFEDLQVEVIRLSNLIARLATLATGTQKRQCEMRADLMKAGAFEKKGKIILPRDLN